MFYINPGTPLVKSGKLTLECNEENEKNWASQAKAGLEEWGLICSSIYSDVQSISMSDYNEM